MKLKWIEPTYIGPFLDGEKPHSGRMLIDKEVTVITGANDVGKSITLRTIESVFANKPIPELEQSSSLLLQGGAEKGDPACWFCIEADADDKNDGLIAGDFEPADELVFEAKNSTSFTAQLRMVYRAGREIKPNTPPAIKKLPQVLLLAGGPEIGNVIELNKLNSGEQKLLALAFGQGYSLQQHAALSNPIARAARLQRAAGTLNERIKGSLPRGMSLTFLLTEVPQNPNQISLTVIDPIQVYAPLGQRGAGVRKIITILGHLAMTDPALPTLILLDEPETSLHADAQHSLRRLLEQMAKQPNTQVIYATHSPSMINNMRPKSIRVIRRGAGVGAKPGSIIENEAFGGNYFLVRSSLGLTPADSLLYATVSIVVEGETELTCLQTLLVSLGEGGVEGFSGIADILENCHFLNGNGGEFPQVCRLVRSQRGVVFGLVDGDKSGDDAKKAAEKLGITVVQLPRGSDIESTIPEQKYLEAVKQWLTSRGESELVRPAYDEFLKQNPGVKNAPLSGRVTAWIQCSFNRGLSKPEIFMIALKNVEIAEIANSEVVGALRTLVGHIRSAIGTTP